MKRALLLLLVLVLIPFLASIANASSAQINYSCDESGIFFAVSCDYCTVSIEDLGSHALLVSDIIVNRTKGYAFETPTEYSVMATDENGNILSWVSIKYDGSSCQCTGGACLSLSGGSGAGSSVSGSGSGDDGGSSCSGWCNHDNWVCKVPGLSWVCDLVCNLCRITNALQSAIKSIANFFSDVVNAIKKFGNMIIDGIKAIGGFFADIGGAIIDFFTMVASKVTGFVSAISSFFGSLASAVYSFFTGLWNLITAPFRALIDKIGGGLSSLGSSGMTWRQYLFIIGTALMVGGAFASGRGRILLAVGAIIVAYVMFSDPQFIYGIMKSPYLVIAAGAFLLVYAALRLRE